MELCKVSADTDSSVVVVAPHGGVDLCLEG